ncbi:MAG: type II secretion system protein GspC [Gammaproteobacteria bacterium]|nr:type II secretion system protein GspC [Gammaproteobacteria bacterium]
MNWQHLSQSSAFAGIVRFFSSLPVARLNQIFSVVLVITLAWLAARITWFVVPTPAQKPLQVSMSGVKTQSNNSSELERVISAKLFGQYQEKATEVVQTVTDAPQTTLNLKLTGVVATGKTPEQGTAIIENNGVEQVYAIDEQIDGSGAVLKQVIEDRVILQVNGRMETLMLDGLEYQQLTVANSAIEEGQLQEAGEAGPDEMGPAQGDIDELRREMTAEPMKLFDYIRVQPRNRGGKMYGYALLPGKDPKMFAQFGLQPNDVAVEINGVRLDDMQQAYSVMQELGEAKQVSIKLERDGEMKDISISLSQ